MNELDKRVLLVSLIAGTAAAIVDLVLYSALIDTMSKPVLIGLLAAVFALIVGTTISVVVYICRSSSDTLWFISDRPFLMIAMAVCIVVVFAMGMFLEWIYDHSEIKADAGDAFVFILDESGSMESNDPNYERYAAVNIVMEGMSEDFPFMVYMFDDDCVKIRDLAPRSAGEAVRPADADATMGGTTYISGALTHVYRDIQNGILGSNVVPQIILLTDGYANDIGPFWGKAIFKDYAKSNIRVSSVGLGAVDSKLMQEIADKTGGVFIQVTDASQLTQGFTHATSARSERDLLSVRNLAERDVLYLILRILFLTLLGSLIALIKAVACGDEESFLWIMALGSGGALLGAIIVEAGLKLGLPAWICQLLYWLLLSITPHFVTEPAYGNGSGKGNINHSTAGGRTPAVSQKTRIHSNVAPGAHRNVDWSNRR